VDRGIKLLSTPGSDVTKTSFLVSNFAFSISPK
jgi:hypothetical protein